MIAYIEWNVKPQIVDLGFIELRWYSLLFLVGFIGSYYVFGKIFKKEGVPMELLDKLTFYVVISTIIGARLGHCLFYEPEIYLKNPLKIILPFEGTIGVDFHFIGFQGLASHGGAIGILIGLYLFARKYKRPYIWILDRIAVMTAFAGSMIRLGNLFNSEIIGKPTELPWGFKFMKLVHPETPVEQVVARHPAQIYEALLYMIIFVILYSFYFRKYPKIKPGYLIGFFWVLLFSVRFLIEFVKDDQVEFEADMILNMGQILSLPFIFVGLYLMFRKVKAPVSGKEGAANTV